MSKKLFAYCAGPYSEPDPPVNTAKAIDFGNWLLDHGYIPLVPHLSMYQHMAKPRPWQEWLDIDLELIKRVDVLIRMPGKSTGADMEVEHARKLGIPVLILQQDDGWQHRTLNWLEDVQDSTEVRSES